MDILVDKVEMNVVSNGIAALMEGSGESPEHLEFIERHIC